MSYLLRCVYCDGLAWVVTEEAAGRLTLERVERRAEGGTRHQVKRGVRVGDVEPVRKEARA